MKSSGKRCIARGEIADRMCSYEAQLGRSYVLYKFVWPGEDLILIVHAACTRTSARTQPTIHVCVCVHHSSSFVSFARAYCRRTCVFSAQRTRAYIMPCQCAPAKFIFHIFRTQIRPRAFIHIYELILKNVDNLIYKLRVRAYHALAHARVCWYM